ncbi:putative MscS family protein YkuT [Anaerohalosphaera lusitana]|uniref:Putative MscS family protein YkuT n=1 Tax=Anaerohalosphaera lusitana TaxID=1936003 RepID=A0A1U9NQX4_9BACT|nr:mechanosensitive ion channel family protein [Anaerohalosphaera lusitana]AQT70187.1 putative MscS family protein YkuT [Anaerohalosphaera lusitana]
MAFWEKIKEAFDLQAVLEAAGGILVTVILALIAQLIFSKLLDRLENRLIKKNEVEGEPPSESAKRIGTLIKLIKRGVYIAVWVVALVIVLGELNVEIGPILAGAGILGLAVGFGAQNLVRDVISGFFIILENQIRVGDVAIINGTGGLVEQINFRTTVLRDLSGVVHVFPNGTINTLANMTNEWSAHVFNIGVAYKENTDRVTEVIKQVCAEMREDPEFGPAMIGEEEIFGVDSFGDSAVMIKGRIKTKPILQWKTGREFNRRIKLAFDEKDIEIPFPHVSLYAGEATKPFDLQVLQKTKENASD